MRDDINIKRQGGVAGWQQVKDYLYVLAGLECVLIVSV